MINAPPSRLSKSYYNLKSKLICNKDKKKQFMKPTMTDWVNPYQVCSWLHNMHILLICTYTYEMGKR